ncbi:MAG: hypothetical protein IID03_05760 [Candidatus Dadabacteria bacterium]|nr:hypothetical protein [Candidatus Dadabacteria bacterium]
MVKKNKNKITTTNAYVEKFEILSPMLDSLFAEIKEMSKKKQDGVLNKLKVDMVNKVLEQI